jgi:hypothetical protein
MEAFDRADETYETFDGSNGWKLLWEQVKPMKHLMEAMVGSFCGSR